MSIVIRAKKQRALSLAVPSGPAVGRRNRRRARSASSAPRAGGLALAVGRDYARTLYDPWEFPGVKLGFGTMESTGTATAYVRNSLTVNADGTFGVALTGATSAFVYKNVSGVSGTTWTADQASNSSALAANYGSARIVSGGIRLFCLFPTTSASGVLFAGTLSQESAVGFTAKSIATLTGLSSSELGIGTAGASVRMLPIDPYSFTFENYLINGSNSSAIVMPNSIPYIVGNAFPSGTTVWYEAVVNYEVLAADSINAVGIDPDDAPQASNHWSNLESLYSYARSLFPSPVVMDGAAVAVGLVHPTAGRVLNVARSMMRRSNHVQTAAEAAAHRQGRQSTLVIEEMKDDAVGSSSVHVSRRRF